MIIKSQKSKRDLTREHEHHQKQMPGDYYTRREFLERGLVGISSSLVVPSIFSIFTQSEIAAGITNDIKKVFIVDLPGGAGIGAEIALLMANGTMPAGPTYFRTGAPDNRSVNTQFGAPIWSVGLLNQALTSTSALANTPNTASIFNAFAPTQITVASTEVRQRLKIIVLQHPNSMDDLSSNPTLGTQSIANAAIVAQMPYKVKGGLQGRSRTNFGTGGFAQPAFTYEGLNPAITNELSQLENLFKLNQGALASLNASQLQQVANASFAFSEAVKRTLGAVNPLAGKASNGSKNLQELASNTPDLDLTRATHPERTFYNDIFRFSGLNNSTQENRNLAIAANTKAVLDGLTPLAVFSENDQLYDYHIPNPVDGWRTVQHPMMIDQTMKLLNALAAKNQSGIVAWHTNGAITFGPGQTADGDGGSYHAGVLFVLSKPGDPVPESFRVGGANNEGGGDSDINTNILARNPSFEGHALLANLLSLSGVPKSDFSRFMPGNISLAEFQALSKFRT
ncbi:hypothetical protein EBR78_02390 [bacterium]|nr:hypothetical protein [bacterium]